MKLTTARLKKLIREELDRMNENTSDIINFSRGGDFTWVPQSSVAKGYGVKRALGEIYVDDNIWLMKVRFETKNGFNKEPLFEIAGSPMIKKISSTKIVPFLDMYIDKYYNHPKNKNRGIEATEKSLTSSTRGGISQLHVFDVMDKDLEPFLDRSEK